MIITLSKNFTRKDVEEARKKLKKKKKLKAAGKATYFGALKRGLDGLEYQKKVRDEWS